MSDRDHFNERRSRQRHHYHFVTGKLASGALRDVVRNCSQRFDFDYSIGVMPITVAALMTPKWLLRHLNPSPEATHVVVPGYVDPTAAIDSDVGDLQTIVRDRFGVDIIAGPNDCRDLPQWFGAPATPPDLSQHSIEIIAEINHVPRLPVEEFATQAGSLSQAGADRIDIGCDPSNRCLQIADYVKAAVDQGLSVSIDTFDASEVGDAVAAGADLVLSVNSFNRNAATQWGCEVVAIPDSPENLGSLDETVDHLRSQGVPCRLDAILEPIGAGLFASLQRYADVRRRYPDQPMMMGIGNVTELTDVDSAGLNFLLLGICQELNIGSVLTTQVINWARSSVRECDVARRLVHHAIANGVPPKRLSDDLVMLRDPKLRPYGDDVLAQLARSLKDNNYRIFAEGEQLHLLSAGLHVSDEDPFRLFDRLMAEPQADNVDASHAFYLGYELAKASMALQLGKQYNQDQSLRWGMLTIEEDLHRIARTSRHRQ